MGIFKKSSSVSTLIMEQIKDVEGCLINFENFMRAAVKPEIPMETLRSLSVGVHQMENAADRSLRVMIDFLGSANYLPSPREDLISIAAKCDKVANKCQHAAMLIIVQKFRFPEKYGSDVMEILEITKEQFQLLKESVCLLFSKFNELLSDHSILDEIREHESRVDRIEERLYERIYDEPIGLAERNQMAGFVEMVSDISDIIEDIADSIQIILITRKG